MVQKKEVEEKKRKYTKRSEDKKYIYIHEADYNKQTVAVPGLNFSQIISLLGLLALLGAAWVDLSVKLERIDVKYDQKTEFLEKGRVANVKSIEQNRTENKQEHQLMLDKLDLLLQRRKN